MRKPSNMPNAEAISIAGKFAPYVKRAFPDAEVYLFGSQARGEQHKGSDIDVGILIPTYDAYPDGYPARLLGELYVDAFEVDRRIEPSLRAKGDSSGFADVIAENGIRIM